MSYNQKIANYSEYQHKNEWINAQFHTMCLLVYHYDEVSQDLAYPALKYLFKYCRWLEEWGALSADHETNLIQWCYMIRMKQYHNIIHAFDTLFSEKDWDDAERYFAAHPDEPFAGSNNKLMYSYVKSDAKVFRRNIMPLGEGIFGRVTYSSLRDNTAHVVTKRQNGTVKNFDMQDCKLEAEINLNLGIAYTDLIIREKDGVIYKVYQVMHYLGEPLMKVIPGRSLKTKLDYAIKLLLAVHHLHMGHNIGGKPYTHGDIKPENILINTKDNTLHLIDFGLSKDKLLDQLDFPDRGSVAYYPVDLKDLVLKKQKLVIVCIANQTTRYFDDKFAALRTIYYPPNQFYASNKLLSHEDFARLPTAIRQLLDTTRVINILENNASWTLRLIAAALIVCKDKQIINDEIIHSLVQNKALQDEIIDCYTKKLSYS